VRIRILAALPQNHPLAKRRRIAREALASENLLLMEDGHCSCVKSVPGAISRAAKAGDDK